MAALLELFDPAVVFVRELGEPGQVSYIGIGEVRRLLEGDSGEWERCRYEVDELQEVDGDRVLASGRVIASHPGPSSKVELPFAALWTLRDGKATRIESYRHREEALAALKRSP